MRTIEDRTGTVSPSVTTTPLVLAAIVSAGAGLVHAAAAGGHPGDGGLAALFALAASAQIGWAALAFARPARSTAVAGAVVNGGLVAVWALTRVTEMPLITSIGGPEAVTLQDGVAAALGAGAVGLALWSVASGPGPEVLRRRPVATLVALAVLAVCVPAVAAGHDHDHGQALVVETPPVPTVVVPGGVSAGESAGAEVPDPEPTPEAHDHADHDGGPIISLYDPRLTVDQRAAARELIAETQVGMDRFPDVESVLAAGYLSIGDGGTGFEHFVHLGYMADGRELDPDRIESIVARVHPDGSREIVSAMYLLEPGATMADVPDIAGSLTEWHDHQDLCWEGVRVVGRVSTDGTCPRGDFRGTVPMLHVWMVPHPCGPFAGLEGHGEGCGHDH
ncbi:MAG: hypothetical protein ACXIVQ_02630 [Acidimicrobiales bacterium]